MIDAGRHPRIKLLTMSEVVALEGKPGDFKATILKHPRYVDESRCTGCGDCVSKCPYTAEDAFDLGLRKRKAIYIQFPQAVPSVAVIDREHCQYFKTGKCRICEKVCRAEAINFKDRGRKTKLNVGAVILATGFEPCDGSILAEYGFGTASNVITSLQYERMTSASGPTGGELLRPSDLKPPKSIVFIQCVGSRDERYKPYCSAVCCMHATKEAILAAEQLPGIDISIFYTDMRSPGKGFQEYVNKARDEHDIRYIRSRPGRITEDEKTGDLSVAFDDMESQRLSKVVTQMVVLCHALIPSGSNTPLAEALGVDLDEHGFVKTPGEGGLPFETSTSGILACGFCSEPQDIPDSVVQASAAAAYAAELLHGKEG